MKIPAFWKYPTRRHRRILAFRKILHLIYLTLKLDSKQRNIACASSSSDETELKVSEILKIELKVSEIFKIVSKL